MNADYRKGWRAACDRIERELRKRYPGGSEEQIQESLVSILADLVSSCSTPPHTMTVVDEEGRRLL